MKASLKDLGSAPTLDVGKSYPPGKSMDETCGAFVGRVSEDDASRFKR